MTPFSLVVGSLRIITYPFKKELRKIQTCLTILKFIVQLVIKKNHRIVCLLARCLFCATEYAAKTSETFFIVNGKIKI